MKLNFNKDDTTKAVYAFLVVAAGILFYFLTQNFSPIMKWTGKVFGLLMPFVYAFCIAYILNPLLNMCEKLYDKLFKRRQNLRIRRISALVVTYLLTLLCITLFVWVISPQIKESIVSIAYKLTVWTPAALAKIEEYAESISVSDEWLMKFEDFAVNMGNRILSYSKDSIVGIWGGVKNVTVFLYNLLFGIIISVYMLNDKEVFLRQTKKLAHVCFKRRVADKIINTFTVANGIFKGFFIGKVVDSLIMGVLCALFMKIFKMPYVALVSFVFGITNIIPYFGAILGSVLGTLFIFISDPITAFWFLVLAVVLQQIDGNIINPKILSNSTGISAFWVIFSIVLGGGLFGVIGMLLGVPAFALIFAVLKAFFNKQYDKSEESKPVTDTAKKG